MHSRRFPTYGSLIFAALPAFAPALAQAQTQTNPAPTPAPRPAQEAQAPAKTPEDKGVVVTGVRSEVVSSPDRLSFNVANDLNAQTGTLADALRAVPGVEVDLQGKVSLRGDGNVEIMIDGRPSAMLRGEGRGDVLLSMPASQIERVEVITNPSAAMSPEGSGGVINLVTKQARRDTRTATIRATADSNGGGGIGANGAMQRGKTTMTGDLGFRHFAGEGGIDQDRARLDTGSGSFVSSRLESDQQNRIDSGNARFAIDYDPNKANRFSGEVNFNKGSTDSERTDVFESQNAASSYDRFSDTHFENRYLGLRGSWRRTLPGQGHELVADLEYGRVRFDRDMDAVTTPATGAPLYERIGGGFDRDDYGVKLDYKRPLGTSGRTLNLGYEFDAGRNNFDSSGARGPAPDQLAPVAALTNRFDYAQDVHAFYGTAQAELGKLELMPGLRFEQVEMEIDQITDGIHVESDYFRVYPTLHIGYELSAKQKLRASYSRRIQRPSAQDMNPYTQYLDPQNLRRGNPDLRPEVTDSFELSWQLRDGGTFYSLTGYYRASSGGVTDVITDIGNGIFLTTRANLSTAKRAGVDAIANGKFGRTLGYNLSASLFWNEIDPRQAGVSARRSGTGGSARANLTWQPTAKDYFQLTGFYFGQQLQAQGYRQGVGILNLGYRRKLNDRLSLTVTGQNLLDTNRVTSVVETATLRDRVRFRGPGPMAMLSLSYTLGEGRRRPEQGIEFDGGGGVPQ